MEMIKYNFSPGEHVKAASRGVDMFPKESASRELLLTEVRFTDLGLPENILKGIEAAGFAFCTPIQAKCLPLSLEGKDIAGQAQTGTGKTAAFLITLFNLLQKRSSTEGAKPRALILAPTRELVVQIFEECTALGRFTDFSTVAVFGGLEYRKQEKLLRQGIDIVVATPGRLIDYLKHGVLSLDHIEALVIDEADRMFDMGFVKDLRYILKKLPNYAKRQSMLFSATLGYRVMELTYEFMNLPEEIIIDSQVPVLSNIHEILYHVDKENKFRLLLGLLARNAWERVLIFTNTKMTAGRLAPRLKANGFSACGISGDLPQAKRLRIMRQFKAGNLGILVATDVASRGIHVENIDAVINYDLPQDPESYIHRIGRTGRVGKAGVAVTLVDEEFVFHLESIEHYLKRTIPAGWPEDDWFIEEKVMGKNVAQGVRHPVRTTSRSKKEGRDESSYSRRNKRRTTNKRKKEKPSK